MSLPEDEGSIDQEQALIDALEETAPPARPSPEEKGLRRRIRHRADEAWDLAARRRSSSRMVDAAMLAVERNRRVPATLLAGALASRLVIFIIPFLVLTVVATGLYTDISGASPAEVARDAGMAGLLADAVGDSTEASQGFRIVTLITMVFATLWAADSLAKLVRRIHALVWEIPMPRPQRRWALPLIVLLVSVGGLAISRLGLDAGDWPPPLVTGEIVSEFVLVTLGWLLLTRLMPHHPEAGRWIHQLPGSLLVAAGIMSMKLAMIVYFAPRAVTLSARYGDIAAAVLLITWAYWIAFIVVFSVEMNVALFASGRRRRHRSRR